METYYQKHKQIRAFQFDGTLKQLNDELQSDVLDSLYHNAGNLNLELPIYYNDKHYIQKLVINDFLLPWNHNNAKTHKHKINYRNQTENNWIFKTEHKFNKNKQRYHTRRLKYKQSLKNIHFGDYISIHHRIEKHRDITEIEFKYRDVITITVHSKAQFENQWHQSR